MIIPWLIHELFIFCLLQMYLFNYYFVIGFLFNLIFCVDLFIYLLLSHWISILFNICLKK